MRKLLFVIVIATPLLAGCNTIAGIGKDVTAVGAAVTKTADDAK